MPLRRLTSLPGMVCSYDYSRRRLANPFTVDLGAYQDAYQKAKTFISKLSIAQKVSVITGESVNGTNFTWTALENKDGFAGINSHYYVSGFPMGNALAMTWDRQHCLDEANAAGREFYLMGYNLINGQCLVSTAFVCDADSRQALLPVRWEERLMAAVCPKASLLTPILRGCSWAKLSRA